LRNIRPRGWPSQFGFASENAAHRIAVTWDESGQTRQGVFVLRRDTNSPWNKLESSFFHDARAFPAGSATLDNILLQRGLEHEWHAPGCAECGQCENRLETMRLSTFTEQPIHH
jgi:hypothetical protein